MAPDRLQRNERSERAHTTEQHDGIDRWAVCICRVHQPDAGQRASAGECGIEFAARHRHHTVWHQCFVPGYGQLAAACLIRAGWVQTLRGRAVPDLSTYVFPPGLFAGVTSRAAKPGDTIVLYGIGFAPIPGIPPGVIPQVASVDALRMAPQPKFYFNGVQAQVSYAGLAPQTVTPQGVTGYIGLYQFNVVVPSLQVPVGAPTAVAVTFTVNVNGVDVPGAQPPLYTSVEN
ncbi:MAG: hypothetical protein WDO73_32305 [Ignavibacteriota bacterium]